MAFITLHENVGGKCRRQSLFYGKGIMKATLSIQFGNNSFDKSSYKTTVSALTFYIPLTNSSLLMIVRCMIV